MSRVSANRIESKQVPLANAYMKEEKEEKVVHAPAPARSPNAPS
jgi:hypothetical protein